MKYSESENVKIYIFAKESCTQTVHLKLNLVNIYLKGKEKQKLHLWKYSEITNKFGIGFKLK